MPRHTYNLPVDEEDRFEYQKNLGDRVAVIIGERLPDPGGPLERPYGWSINYVERTHRGKLIGATGIETVYESAPEKAKRESKRMAQWFAAKHPDGATHMLSPYTDKRL